MTTYLGDPGGYVPPSAGLPVTPGGQSAECLGCTWLAVAAAGGSHEPRGTSLGVVVGRDFCEGVIASHHLLAKGLLRLQSSPSCLWDLLSERGGGDPGEVSWTAGYQE